MKFLIAFLLLCAGLFVICAQGTNLDLLHQHTPVYRPTTYQFGPASVTVQECVQNCGGR